jgi:predicted RNA polymerase sigma factor
MRFMMLVIPKGYEKAAPDFVPPAEAVAEMTKYNDSMRKAGVLLAQDALVLSTEACVALTLRLLGGLTTVEIARAFLVAEATVFA